MASNESPSPAHSYILLEDKRKYHPRGHVVQLKSDGRYHPHSHSRKFVDDSLSASSDEVAALTEKECRILDAIDSLADRYSVYSTPGKLSWGVGLNVGDTVLARMPLKGSSGSGRQQDLYSTAIFRWCGDVDDRLGDWSHCFGVEITVSAAEM